MSDYSGLDGLATECGFILVYPAARKSMWATVNLDATNFDANPDIRFFDRLLEHLESRVRIDGKRIYLVGMSNGASFAQLVAHARPHVAAVVAHSGVKPRELGPAPRPFPILLVVGTRDAAADTIKSDAAEYRSLGHHAEFISIPEWGHEWSTQYNSAIWQFLSKHECNE
jgi:poly(3-hydroxybutyrate) depolymerase